MASRNYLAIDLGAESGRTIVGSLKDDRLELAETYRFENHPITLPDGLHWDVLNLRSQILNGINASLLESKNSLLSLGVDAWGVDFGLLDKAGALLENPFHHRDHRTDGVMEQAFEIVSRDEIYAHTGIQFMQINTLYQLLAMRISESPQLEIAEHLLTIPDLFNYWLSGEMANEFTNATTTQCLDPASKTWATDLLEQLEIPTRFLGELIEPGTPMGRLRLQVNGKTPDIPVIAPACHDTGSAVVAVPAQGDDFAWISSGTWSILGVEMDHPVINELSLENNFTNEGGVLGTWRYSKNVMGLWILQECRRQWAREGEELNYAELTEMASSADAFISFIDPDSPEFLHPGNMATRVQEYCARTNQVVPESKSAIVRVVLESNALKYRQGLNQLAEITGRSLDPVHIIGGGSQNELLNQFTAGATKRTVIAGPVEATSTGNILMQAIGLGHLDGLAEARQIVRNSFQLKTYKPQRVADWDEAYARFQALEQRAQSFVSR